MEKVPMTGPGFVKLEEEIRNLKHVERPAVIRAIAEARAHGDLSENAEYHAAKERQGFIEGRILELEDIVARAQVIDPAKLSGKAVKFGATVTVVDEVQRVVDASPGHGGVGGFLGEVVAGQDQAPVVGCALGFVDRRRVPVGEVPVGGVVERDRDRLVVVSATPHDLSVGVYGVNGRSCAVQ